MNIDNIKDADEIVIPTSTLVKLHSNITGLSLSDSLKWIRNNKDYYHNTLNTFIQKYPFLTVDEILDILKLTKGSPGYANVICGIIKHARQGESITETSNNFEIIGII